MELVYASLILHSVKQPISEENIQKIMQAAGATPDGARIKALVAALEGINIDEAMKQAVMAQAVAPAAPVAEAKKEDEKKDEQAQEQAVAGLGSLFG